MVQSRIVRKPYCPLLKYKVSDATSWLFLRLGWEIRNVGIYCYPFFIAFLMSIICTCHYTYVSAISLAYQSTASSQIRLDEEQQLKREVQIQTSNQYTYKDYINDCQFEFSIQSSRYLQLKHALPILHSRPPGHLALETPHKSCTGSSQRRVLCLGRVIGLVWASPATKIQCMRF